MPKCSSLVLAYFALAFLLIAPALAWNPAGHMAIASIIYDQLSAERRQALVALLRQHPRFTQDFATAMPPELNPEQQARWIFMRASVWPDLARAFQGADQQKYNRPGWHYIDLPVYLDELARERIHVPRFEMDFRKATGEQSMNVVQALNKAVADLNDQSLSQPARAVALCWVLHLASDIHQPLHGAALFSAGRFRGIPIGDRGGNDIHVHESQGLFATYRNPNLHGLWDSLLGSDDSYAGAIALAAQIQIAHPPRTLTAASNQMDVSQWAQESNDAAAQSVYTPDVREVVRSGEETPHRPLPVFEVTDAYLKAARTVAVMRAALAARRTVNLLETPR